MDDGRSLPDRIGAKAIVMCGVAGFFAKTSTTEAQAVLNSMVARLSHRGPDGTDTRVYPLQQGVIGLGHALLSIIGGASDGRQPFEVAGGTLIFNGAIYNFLELRKELESKGHVFRTHTDTEVLAVGFAAEGTAFLAKARGMYAFAFWNSKTKILTLARDPFGVKPMYYYQNRDVLCFASEYKAILPHVRNLEITSAAVADYLCLRYVPGTSTMVEGIKKLPPGHVLEFDTAHSRTRLQRYFHLTPADHELNRDELFEALQTAVKRRSVADVEVGGLLSGGIDSAVACDLLERSVKGLHTYTLQTGDSRIDESGVAKEISERIGTLNTTIPPREPDIETLSRLAYHLDDPYGDPIILALDRIFSSISGRQRVVITGEGADEIFSGYVHHRAAGLLDRIPPTLLNSGVGVIRHLPDTIVRSLLPYAGKLSAADYRRAMNRLSRFSGSMTLSDFQSIFYLFDRSDLLVENSRAVANSTKPEKHGSMLSEVREWDLNHWLPDSQLFKLDKISMASSIEAREPYVDQDLLSAVMAIPQARHISLRRDKPVFRNFVRSRVRVGDEIVAGRKTSFFQPFDRRTSAGLPNAMREIVHGKREFLSRYVSTQALDEVLESSDPGLLAQKRLFALGMLVLWEERVWRGRSEGVRLGNS